jgi:hypothetical protein
MSRQRTSARNLPDETQPRIRILVEQSAPDPNKPKIPEEIESAFEPVERMSAACYASMEERTFQLQKLANEIERRKTPATGVPVVSKGDEK